MTSRPTIAASHLRSISKRPEGVSRETSHPFLINKDTDGNFRLTLRETRYNSQGYPLVSVHLQPECFRTATQARAFAKENFRAEAGQFTTK